RGLSWLGHRRILLKLPRSRCRPLSDLRHWTAPSVGGLKQRNKFAARSVAQVSISFPKMAVGPAYASRPKAQKQEVEQPVAAYPGDVYTLARNLLAIRPTLRTRRRGVASRLLAFRFAPSRPCPNDAQGPRGERLRSGAASSWLRTPYSVLKGFGNH